MSPVSPIYNSDNNKEFKMYKKLIVACFGVGILLVIAILALVIATFVKVNNQTTTVTTTPVTNSLNSILAQSMHVDEVMNYLKELQRIATANNGNRAANTLGFNQTLDYITSTLAINTDYNVSKSFFLLRRFALTNNSTPSLISSINGVSKTYTYSNNLSIADFYHVQFSTGANFSTFADLTAIPNVGCSDDDWQNANPPPAGRVALVKRGICAFTDKGNLAVKYNVSGLLIYNDGVTPDRMPPIEISLGQDTYLPALFLSYPVGEELAQAAQNPSTNAGVRLIIDVQNLPMSPNGNICADTPTGDVTQTIVIGSHSDSVPAGPGINDNGELYDSTYYTSLSLLFQVVVVQLILD
jgi:aminopeptidase Y